MKINREDCPRFWDYCKSNEDVLGWRPAFYLYPEHGCDYLSRAFMAKRQEITTWCLENCKGEFHPLPLYMGPAFLFQLELDAVLFKLRWC